MVHVRKPSLHQLFPFISILSAVLIRYVENHGQGREAMLIKDYCYFNILFPAFYLFLIAYTIPLFCSIRLSRQVSRLLNVSLLILVCLYIVISAYAFITTSRHDFLQLRNDRLIGIATGIVLGITTASLEPSVKEANE